MKQYNILNNYNEDTELNLYISAFDNDNDDNLKNEEITKEKEQLKIILTNLLIPDFKKINITRDVQLYLTLSLFFIIAIINIFLRKQISNYIAVMFLIYTTLCLTTKLNEIPNTRYANITTWNLSNSLKMIFKLVFPTITEKIDYIKLMSFSNLIHIILLGIAIIPSYSYLTLISLTIILISYLYSFSHQDLESIKESTNNLNTISFLILIITSIIGSIFYGSNAINLVGYITWLILYSINYAIKDYEFKKI